MPVKYVYMGTATGSSNVALPTTRLILYLKKRRHRRRNAQAGQGAFTEHGRTRRGRLGATASLLNRIAEEWYRQVVAWWYELRGNVVLFDRHFLFEHAAHARELRQGPMRLTDRIHLAMLYRLYPRPDLVLFLDAPLPVLLARKQEWSEEHLRRHREGILEIGTRMARFVTLDATRPLDDVVQTAAGAILEARAGKSG